MNLNQNPVTIHLRQRCWQSLDPHIRTTLHTAAEAITTRFPGWITLYFDEPNFIDLVKTLNQAAAPAPADHTTTTRTPKDS